MYTRIWESQVGFWYAWSVKRGDMDSMTDTWGPKRPASMCILDTMWLNNVEYQAWFTHFHMQETVLVILEPLVRWQTYPSRAIPRIVDMIGLIHVNKNHPD